MTVIFPKWTNYIPTIGLIKAMIGLPLLVSCAWYYFSPMNTDVGYAPHQPVPYSHKLHAGLMGMDCRYCHQNVEKGPLATIPTTQTCMNCHSQIKLDSDVLQPVREAMVSDQPIEWIKVHMLPDYSYFSHAAHVNAGVGCVSCHGRVDQMEIVRQEQPLSMGWCLECHRAPENHLRPKDEVTNMEYEHDMKVALKIKEEKNINPPTHCSACHR